MGLGLDGAVPVQVQYLVLVLLITCQFEGGFVWFGQFCWCCYYLSVRVSVWCGAGEDGHMCFLRLRWSISTMESSHRKHPIDAMSAGVRRVVDDLGKSKDVRFVHRKMRNLGPRPWDMKEVLLIFCEVKTAIT